MSVFNSKVENSTDYYGTPKGAFNLVSPYLPEGIAWEPCRGYGAIENYLKDLGREVVSTDISTGQNALVYQPERWDFCVTNPPWSLKGTFLERFYKLGKPFAMLLPCDLVNGTRTKLFEKYGIQLIIPSWRVKYLRFDGERPVEAGAPNTGSAWFCWGFNLPKDLVFVTERSMASE